MIMVRALDQYCILQAMVLIDGSSGGGERGGNKESN
jgi:hypothetical protein